MFIELFTTKIIDLKWILNTFFYSYKIPIILWDQINKYFLLDKFTVESVDNTKCTCYTHIIHTVLSLHRKIKKRLSCIDKSNLT